MDDPDRGDLIDPPIEDDLDEGDGDESDADVLAGLKDGAGDVALMESEDLLREIKPEPMEHDGPVSALFYSYYYMITDVRTRFPLA